MPTAVYAVDFDGEEFAELVTDSRQFSNTLSDAPTIEVALPLDNERNMRVFQRLDLANPKRRAIEVVLKFEGERRPRPNHRYYLLKGEVANALDAKPVFKATGVATGVKKAQSVKLPEARAVASWDMNPEAPVSGDIPKVMAEADQFDVFIPDPKAGPNKYTPVANPGVYIQKFRRWALTKGPKGDRNPKLSAMNGIRIKNYANLDREDALGVPWRRKLAESFSYGISFWDFGRTLAERGMMEFTYTGDVLTVANVGGIGRDLSGGKAPLTFGGVTSDELPIRVSLEEMVTRLTGVGAGKRRYTAELPEQELAARRLDFHIEDEFDFSNVTRMDVLREGTEFYLREYQQPGMELTFRFRATKDRLLPVTGFDVGDKVRVEYLGLVHRLRVMEWTRTENEESGEIVTVTVGRRFVKKQYNTWRRLKDIASGKEKPTNSGNRSNAADDPYYDPNTGWNTVDEIDSKLRRPDAGNANDVLTLVDPATNEVAWKPGGGGPGGTVYIGGQAASPLRVGWAPGTVAAGWLTNLIHVANHPYIVVAGNCVDQNGGSMDIKIEGQAADGSWFPIWQGRVGVAGYTIPTFTEVIRLSAAEPGQIHWLLVMGLV